MEYLQKCFCKATSWNEDNIYANVTATSRALLDFSIPSGGKLDITSQATDHLASSMTLLNHNSIHGSLAYLYSSAPLKNTAGTKDVSLQDALAGFRIIEPHMLGSGTKTPVKDAVAKPSLMYGRIYFPGSSLEAMVIRRLTELTQLLVKCINNPHLSNNGTMIVYLQENVPRYSREYIYSTTEALFGFRCLYNFGNPARASATLIPKFDNSVVSVGAELWYAAKSMSPGLSTAFRYSTRSTSTGKPLTMTFSCNPILGHISSTYNVKTSVSSTVCSKYDFNWFSYASNLSIGFELFNFSKPSRLFHHGDKRFDNHKGELENGLGQNENAASLHKTARGDARQPVSGISTPDILHNSSIHYDTLAPPPAADPALLTTHTTSNELAYTLPTVPRKRVVSPVQNVDDFNYMHRLATFSDAQDAQTHTAMKEFETLVNESNFSSVIKGSTSLNDQMLKLLWVGRYKDFLVSTGVRVGLNKTTATPEVNKFGVTFAYAC